MTIGKDQPVSPSPSFGSSETGEGLDKLRKWLDEKIGYKFEK